MYMFPNGFGLCVAFSSVQYIMTIIKNSQATHLAFVICRTPQTQESTPRRKKWI